MWERLNRQRARIWAFVLAHVSIRLAVGLGVSIACLWLFANLAEDVVNNESLVLFDAALADFLHLRARPDLTAIFFFITDFGSPIAWALGIIVGIIYALRRRWLYVLVWTVALAGGELLNMSLKAFFARPRPIFEDPLLVAHFYSFPSGHAMFSMIVYGMLAYFLLQNLRSRFLRLLVIALTIVIILLIGFSRLYLGVHYFSDVVAGFAAGALWLITCISAMEFIRQRRTML